jgi:hypothetical protein
MDARRRCMQPLPLIVLAGLGCSDHPTYYGPPGGLAGKLLPPPSQSMTSAPSVDADGGGPPVDAGGPSTEAATLPADAESCSVSWTAQLFVNMTATGKWTCGDSSCHGGLQPPKVTSDPNATYASFVAFKMTPPAPAIPYLLPGSSDPAKSGLECNLSGNGCGPQMPLTQGGARLPTAQEMALVDAWVRCGAPDN